MTQEFLNDFAKVSTFWKCRTLQVQKRSVLISICLLMESLMWDERVKIINSMKCCSQQDKTIVVLHTLFMVVINIEQLFWAWLGCSNAAWTILLTTIKIYVSSTKLFKPVILQVNIFCCAYIYYSATCRVKVSKDRLNTNCISNETEFDISSEGPSSGINKGLSTRAFARNAEFCSIA